MELQVQEFITLREVLRLVLLSGCLTVASGLVFPHNSLSRRTFLSIFAVILLCMPWLTGGERWVWELGLEQPPAWSLGIPVPVYLLVTWWVVALLFVLSALFHVRRVHKQIRALPIIDATDPTALLVELSQRLGLTRNVVLRMGMAPCSTTLCAEDVSPRRTTTSLPRRATAQTSPRSTANLFRGRGATIILPAEYETWSEESLRAVLAHELVHVHRCDDRWMLLVRLVSLWYWWMPWLHWLYARYVRAVEESCDDRASEVCRRGAGYLHGVVAAIDGRTSAEDGRANAEDGRTPGAEDGRTNAKDGRAGARGTSVLVHPVPYLPHLGEHPLVARVARFAGLREQELDTGGIYWVALGLLGAISLLVSVKPVVLPPTPVSNLAVNVLAIPAAPEEASRQALYPVVQSSVWLPTNIDRLVLKRISKPAYEPLPVFPGMALRRGIEGDVLVEYSVSADGAVSQARIIRSTPPDVFDATTLRAVRQTEYLPTYRFDGQQTTRHYGTDPPGSALRVQKEFRFRISAE
ncbi:MAG: TonB family protein [Gammaproteobacteria bacterium]|nr:TonB family protein [Gammaproteobacteria bacterium]